MNVGNDDDDDPLMSMQVWVDALLVDAGEPDGGTDLKPAGERRRGSMLEIN